MQRQGSVRRRGSAEDKKVIRLHHAFGGQSSSDTGALLLGDTTVLHRAGRWLVSQEISADGASPARLSPMTFFFELDAAVTRLTAMCVSENRKFIALCEACDPPGSPPQLRVVQALTRKTVCVLSAAIEGEFIGCAFHSDGKHVLAYTGAPEHVTAVWQWVDERPLGMYRSRTPLGRVAFNPTTASLMSLSSPMRLARLNESGHFKEIEVTAIKRYGAQAADHCWLATKVLVFIDGGGTIRVLADSALKQSLTRGGAGPTCLAPLRRGFVAGCTDGVVLVYLRDDDDADGGLSLACSVRGPSGQPNPTLTLTLP